MPEVDLLDKTEVWITGVRLTGADLREVALAAARAMLLVPESVFVTDARDDHIVLDVLQPRIELANFLGRQDELLGALRTVPGVAVAASAEVHSYGVLGLIGSPPEDAAATVERATVIDENLRAYVSTRIAVVSTGPEVVAGNIDDTNLATIRENLTAAGYEVTGCGAVLDDEEAIAGRVLRLVSEGFGVVITTGGVGAEHKDRTIEALQRCDPDLATDVLATYEVGHGRHAKPHVRIGVGAVQWTRLIALPGPTREVAAAMPVVVEGLRNGWSRERLAAAIGRVLRDCLR